MFEDKKITKEKVKDLLYNVQNEILNELDFDYESQFKKDITKNDLEIIRFSDMILVPQESVYLLDIK